VHKVEVYARVRRAVQVDGMSERQAAREFGLARKTVRKMLAYAAPPGYQRKKPVARPKLGPWLGVVDQILAEDESQSKKQRHTARRIFDRLKTEHAFTGGYTIVKDYVREARLQHKEVFVPLAHPPGDAQADFGEALATIGGVEQQAHFLCMDLPHSDDAFVVAFPAENTESFCEGHKQAFAYFGGVPRSILCDNTKIAVKEIAGDGERKPTEEFSRLKSHYLFEAKFGRPAKGNDKGKVEGLVGYARRNFMVPVAYAHQRVLVKAFVWELVIACGSEVIARHGRSYAREEMIFNPLHYLALLEQKTRALDQAAPLQGWVLPAEFDELRRQMEARLAKRGRREYVQVLRLLETFALAGNLLRCGEAPVAVRS
jgi:transposase